MCRARRESTWLHLFTSTIRPLYVSDALDLLALPVGAHFQFRYSGKYLDDETKRQWQAGKLIGTRVAVYFSLQHPANYQEAAYIPLRDGRVVYTEVEGDVYIVRFNVAAYLSLQKSDPGDGANSVGARADAVREFTLELRSLLGDQHPDKGSSATLGGAPDSLPISAGQDGQHFQSVVRCLYPSLYFRGSTLFLRVAELVCETTGKIVRMSAAGYYPLIAGHRYTIRVSHYQPVLPPPDNAALKIDVPEGIRIIGRGEVPIASKYDVVPIGIFVAGRDDVTAGEIEVSIEGEFRQPIARVPVEVRPSRPFSMSSFFLGAGGALLLGLPAVFAGGQNFKQRVALVIFGSVVVGFGLFLRRRRGLAS